MWKYCRPGRRWHSQVGNRQTSQGHTQDFHSAAGLICCLRQSTSLLPASSSTHRENKYQRIQLCPTALENKGGETWEEAFGHLVLWQWSLPLFRQDEGKFNCSFLSLQTWDSCANPTERKRDVDKVWEPLGTGIYGGERLQFADRTSFFLPC